MMHNLLSQFEFTVSGLSPLWLGCMLAFIGLWVAELFFVQKTTLISVQDSSSTAFSVGAPRLRLMLNACFVVAVSMFLPRMGLLGLSVIVFLVHMGLVSHYQYFLRPLSALSLFHNWREGVKTGGYTFGVRLTRLTWALLLILGLKLVVLVAMPAESGINKWFMYGIGLVALLGYLALAAAASYVDPLDKIRTTRGFGRLGDHPRLLHHLAGRMLLFGAARSAGRRKAAAGDRA